MASILRTWPCLLAAVLAWASPAAFAQQAALGIDVEDTPWLFRDQAGRRLSFFCPASDRWFRPVWGTDVYTADSKLCSAALHAGVLQFGRPGLVTIVIGTHAEPYVGSTRYGVTSEDVGVWPMSFTFDTSGTPAEIEWKTTAVGVPPDFNEPITVVCPGNGNLKGQVYGEDIYTNDSAICVAAVHARVITQSGGPVQVSMSAGRDSYVGSDRNGVVSKEWLKMPVSFVVASPGKSGGATKDRTIQLAGFTAAGVAATVIPRTIQLKGFSGTGRAPEVVRRTIQLKGWVGAGESKALTGV